MPNHPSIDRIEQRVIKNTIRRYIREFWIIPVTERPTDLTFYVADRLTGDKWTFVEGKPVNPKILTATLKLYMHDHFDAVQAQKQTPETLYDYLSMRLQKANFHQTIPPRSLSIERPL